MRSRLALPRLHQEGRYRMPGWELSFICSGHTFKAFVRAQNQHAASHEALLELAHQCPDFEPENARLVRSVQVQ